ncbi:hypothetical protein PVAP13_3KG093654 [Panicum virgatum]|uniref:Uncharacterized protein n=1 Tax=Panicum virgatum TaxID=38727 RepID=A0A8T0UN12_PANVG|nr:hypothetical protein PVAP13_3KG093654 [Panicum virgatum]
MLKIRKTRDRRRKTCNVSRRARQPHAGDCRGGVTRIQEARNSGDEQGGGVRRRFHLHQSTTAAKVLEASVSLRWPGGSLEGERQGCALCCAPQPQGPKLSWALISAVQLRSDGW